MAEVACTKMNKETCMIEPPLVIGLVGSIRDGSYTEMAVTTALEGLILNFIELKIIIFCFGYF